MKILFIAPHLSTGGAPKYLLKKISELYTSHDVYCIEYADLGGSEFVVQKNQIKELLHEKLITLHDDKTELLNIINSINPDIIHFEELPEYFCDNNISDQIYGNVDRQYKIIETSHDSSFDVNNKRYLPDKFIFVSEYQRNLFSSLNIESEVIEYPIEYKTKENRAESLVELGLDPDKYHIFNIGLFTPRKNQAEIIEYAKKLENENVQFHFIGNQADNFKSYWEPLMENFPSNCKWWGERSDVDKFYNAMDLFLFTSKGTSGDKETNPLVLREAIGWNVPILMYDLDVYNKMHHKFDNIKFLKMDDIGYNLNLIKSKIEVHAKFTFYDLFYIDFDGETNKFTLDYLLEETHNFKIVFKDFNSNIPIYWFHGKFENYNSWFAIPIPIHTLKLVDEPSFNEFLIEVYDEMNVLICDTTYFIKELSPEFIKSKLNIANPFDSIYNNYVEMFLFKKYDCYELDNLDTVIDIGANSGLFSKLCLDKNAKRVISIEPNPICLENLNSILEPYKNVEIISKAISTSNDPITLYTLNEYTTIGSIYKSHLTNESDILEINVESIKLSDVISNYKLDRISLVKIDIEGYEYEIINSLTKHEFDKIDNFLIEFHLNDGIKLKTLINKLKLNGYNISQVRDQNSRDNHYINVNDNPILGTIYANRNIDSVSCVQPKKIITLIDCFVSDSTTEHKLNDALRKFDVFDIFLITNTPVTKDVLSKTTYTLYDSNNRLFSNDVNWDRNHTLFFTTKIDNCIVTDAMFATQPHGLSVMINLFNALKIAKSMGYTHFQRVEVDDIYGELSINFIESTVQSIFNKDKGLFYCNHEKNDISFHYFTCEIDYFLNLIPNILNESDYINAIIDYDACVSVEQLLYQYVSNSDVLLLKNGIDMDVDFPDTTWNTHTSHTYYTYQNDKYNGYYNKLYHKLIDGVDTNEYCVFSINRTRNEFTRIIKIIYNDSTYKELTHASKIENEWSFSMLGMDVSKIQIFDERHTLLFEENAIDVKSTINFTKCIN